MECFSTTMGGCVRGCGAAVSLCACVNSVCVLMS